MLFEQLDRVLVSDAHRMKKIASEFARFSAVGAAGLFVDMAALYFAIELMSLSYLAGRGVSYLAAATFTWACNRSITFASNGSGGVFGQWVRFLAVNSAGGAVNFTVYLLVVAAIGSSGGGLPSRVDPMLPYLGVALGSLSGLLFNFTLSKLLVFR
jgi:putative flippase GtrA